MLLLPLAQDPAPEGTVHEAELTTRARPPMPDEKAFKLRDPLALEGRAATDGELREGLAPAIRRLLALQREDGSWAYDASSGDYLSGFVAVSFSPTCATSLCGMALRAHEPLAPEAIRAAVAKAARYVAAQAPRESRPQYGVWSWSFAIEFLAAEVRRAADPALKEELLEGLKKATRLLLREQHPGKAKRGMAAETELPGAVDMSQGSFLGFVPLFRREKKKQGIAVIEVIGPGQEAGIRPGDRLLEIDGKPLRKVSDLAAIEASLAPGTKVKVRYLRPAEEPRFDFPDLRDGGWSYTWGGGGLSFATATALLALLEAREAGADLPDEVLDRAAALLKACRSRDRDEIIYGYDLADPGMLGARASAGRSVACTLALLRRGGATPADLESTLESFARRRGELDKVVGFGGTHLMKSHMNAAYYFLYAHYYAGRALRDVKDPEKRRAAGLVVQEALLKARHARGTWSDHDSYGELYGTAMALMALGEVSFLAPGAYATPLPPTPGK